MYFRQLTYFIRVAELGSFRAAAETLHVSQPALSQQVAQLEDRYGIRLFRRHSRGVSLTQEGETLLSRGRRILREVERTERALFDLSKHVSGRVSLGVTPTMSRVFVPLLISRSAEEFPGVNLLISEGVSDDLTAAVSNGRLDIAFSYNADTSAGAEVAPLLSECLYLVGPVGQFETEEDEIEFSKLGAFPLILANPRHSTRQIIDRLAVEKNVLLQAKADIEATALKREILINSEGFAIVPYGVFSKEVDDGILAARKVVHPEIRRTLHLLRAKSRLLSPAANAISGLVHELVSQAVKRGDWKWESPVPEGLA